MQVKLLQIREASGARISSAATVHDLMKEERRADREIFFVLHLNTKNQIIEKEIVSIGSLDMSVVHPREVFRKAVLNSTAAMICVHNHPSGDPKPSHADEQVSAQLFLAAELMNIPILDFIVIAESGYFSFADKGLLRDQRAKTSQIMSLLEVDGGTKHDK